MGFSDWQLILNEVVVGQLELREIDQPFFFCDFVPTPEFDHFAPLFAEELRLLNADMIDEWQEAYESIFALNPRLVSDVEEIRELLLHIEGDTAWFRY